MTYRRVFVAIGVVVTTFVVSLILFVAWRLSYGIPEITKAIIAGDVGRVKQMLDSGVDPNTTAPFFMLLKYSRYRKYNQPSTWRATEETLAGVFYQGGEEALLYTASSGAWAKSNWEIVELLLRRDVDLTTEDAWYTFMFALGQGRFDIADMMFAKGFQLERSEGRNIRPPLQQVTRGDLEACKYLFSKGASISPLYWSGVCRLLNGEMEPQANALFLTPQKNEAAIYRLLIEHGLPLHLRLNDGPQTMLHAAVAIDDLELVKFLLDQGFDINYRPGNCRSALDAAKEKGNPEIVKLLESAQATSPSPGVIKPRVP
jgi:hypothetical protein